MVSNAVSSPKRHRLAFTAPLALFKHNVYTSKCLTQHKKITPTAIVILGGTSGVGLETANYLKSKKATATSFSRRTGHDLTDPTVSTVVLDLARAGLAITVGAGRRSSSRDDELALYRTIFDSLKQAPPISLIVTVARQLVLNDVRGMLEQISSPWVLLRPGPLVDEDPRKPQSTLNESLLVTADMRCNGLISRHGVAKVIGDLLMQKVPIDSISNKILGVYDRNRMISLPENIETIGETVWGSKVVQ